MSDALQWSLDRWPSALAEDAGSVPRGAGLITVVVADPASDALVAVERWFDAGPVRSLRAWPGRADRAVPWVMWDRSGQVTAGTDGLAGDRLLASGRFDDHAGIVWDVPPAPDVEGSVVRGLVLGLVEATRTEPWIPDEDQVVSCVSTTANRGAHPGDQAAPLRSWHVVRDGRVMRALETAPIIDSDGGGIRARKAIVLTDARPLQPDGVIVADRTGLRWWAESESEWLDRPATGAAVPDRIAALGAGLRR